MVVENLDKSDLPLAEKHQKNLAQPALGSLHDNKHQNKEKDNLLEEKAEENESKEAVPFESKSNNCIFFFLNKKLIKI